MILLPVEGQQGLYRDINTNAIVNKNDEEYNNYIKRREQLRKKDDKIEHLEDKINSLQNDISEIKNILFSLVNNNNI